MANPSTSTLIAPSGNPLTLTTAWDVLERFGVALQQCDQSAQQIRLVLDAVRESLDADAVFWYPGSGSEPFNIAGLATLSSQWCRDFTERVLAETPGVDGQLLRPTLDPGSNPLTPWPTSAVLVRISKSRSSWVVAVTFDAERSFQVADVKVMTLARRMLLNHRQQVASYEKLKDTLFGLVRCLTAAIDAKDPHTWGHSERVARIAVRLGKQMQLPGAVLSDLYLAGLLHDVGKIGIRDSVLQKPGDLTDEEYIHIQEHPVIGDRLVSNIKQLEHLRPGVRNHHERWDGKGYPDRLKGEEIPFLARLLAVADSCDAMMANRAYRSALPTSRIDAIMTAGAGTQWDPRIIDHFMACRDELYPICQRGIGDSVFLAVERALRATDETSSRKSMQAARVAS
ncbi:MAG: HD-GYP domain-containing protein [Gemmataceae bacterium]|nr:HD-GYP domain-containing protein [Gemmataceae bacterium]